MLKSILACFAQLAQPQLQGPMKTDAYLYCWNDYSYFSHYYANY